MAAVFIIWPFVCSNKYDEAIWRLPIVRISNNIVYYYLGKSFAYESKSRCWIGINGTECVAGEAHINDTQAPQYYFLR